jgi:hypothetical protein
MQISTPPGADETQAVWLRRITRMWWPLAASWLLMGFEGPVLSAVMARLANPDINLAAYGGVVYPLSLLIESPVIMLLSASVALSKDVASYRRIYRFMMIVSAAMTALHALIAFTPLFDLVVVRLMGIPAAVIEPARTGLQLMLPWTWAIGYRRFQQGVMIRFGHSRAVGAGTLTRLAGDALGLAVGVLLGLPGIAVGAGAQALGVTSEAVYAGLRVRPILQHELRDAPPVEPLAWRAFFHFYVPLALTSLLTLLWQPLGSAAMARMPRPVETLAALPALNGLMFFLRSSGMALNEVVVALLDRRGSTRPIHRFAMLLMSASLLINLLLALTPFSRFWFQQVSALRPELVELAVGAFILGIPISALTVLQSLYQGTILHGRVTRGIPESLAAFLLVFLLGLGAGVISGQITGLYAGIGALTLANIAQTLWVWFRSRPITKSLKARDSYPPPPLGEGSSRR